MANNDITVIMLNAATKMSEPKRAPTSLAEMARRMFGNPMPQYLNTLTIAASQAIADTGATSIFVMERVDVKNKRPATKPLTINLPEGRQVKLMHICDINIPGLPMMLMGHIVPNLAIASLFGIRVLCKAGCKVVFDDDKCDVYFKDKLILQRYKDPSTDLWTLPITPGRVWTTPGTTAKSPHAKDASRMACISLPHAETANLMACDLPTVATLPQPGPCIGCAPHQSFAAFTHLIKTRVNAVKFAHQLLCNPKILTLLKAVRRGFLKGCPNISEKLILKYLNPSPAMAKGHMKRPRHGIRSTTPKANTRQSSICVPAITFPVPPAASVRIGSAQGSEQMSEQVVEHNAQWPNLIGGNEDESIANVFCCGAFMDKNSGIVYHDLTGSFPFMSLDGSVCFLVLYHYESNCILGTPIAGLDDKSIFYEYKLRFEELKSKGFKPKLNLMDNQATKHIKKFLTKNECKFQLVEPHNHRVNAAECVI